MSERDNTRVSGRGKQDLGKISPKMRAAGYSRVSDDPQADSDRASLPEQKRSIREYCQRKGYDLLHIFSDVGKRWNANRPDFQRLIAWGKEKPRPFDVIVVWKADRIVGSASTVAALEPLLDSCGIDIEGVVEPVHKQWLLMNAMIAKGETEAKRERSRLGVRTAVNRGHYIGTPPYGRRWNKETKQVELDPVEAMYYRKMFIDWGDWGDGRIARYLNDLGVPTRLTGTIIKRGPRQGQVIGKGWTRSYIRKLRNDRSAYGEGKFKLRDGDELEFPLPKIVDKAVFDEEKRVRTKRRNFGHRGTNRVYPVPHTKFRCGGCGLGFRIGSRSLYNKQRLASGEIRIYRRKALSPSMVCRGMHTYPHIHQCRQPKFVNYDRLQGIVLDNLLEVLKPDFFLKFVCEPKDMGNLEQKVREARDNRDAAKREVTWLVTQGRKGIIPDDVFDLQMRAAKGQLEFWEQQLAQVEAELMSASSDTKRAGEIAYAAAVLRGNIGVEASVLRYLKVARYPDAVRQIVDETARRVREIVENLIDNILVMPDSSLLISYNLPLIDEIRSRQLTNLSLSLYR